jgi:hypothetical protein
MVLSFLFLCCVALFSVFLADELFIAHHFLRFYTIQRSIRISFAPKLYAIFLCLAACDLCHSMSNVFVFLSELSAALLAFCLGSSVSLIVSRDVPECGGATFPWEISNWASSPPVSQLPLFQSLLLLFFSFHIWLAFVPAHVLFQRCACCTNLLIIACRTLAAADPSPWWRTSGTLNNFLGVDVVLPCYLRSSLHDLNAISFTLRHICV